MKKRARRPYMALLFVFMRCTNAAAAFCNEFNVSKTNATLQQRAAHIQFASNGPHSLTKKKSVLLPHADSKQQHC